MKRIDTFLPILTLCLFGAPLTYAQWGSNHGIVGHDGLGAVHSGWRDSGYRPVSFTGFQQDGNPHFSGIWEKRPSPDYYFYYGMNEYWLDKRIVDFGADGYRITSLEHYLYLNEVRYIATWEKWNGLERAVDKSVPLSSIETLVSQRGAEGFRPLDIDVIDDGGVLKVTLIWEAEGEYQRELVWDVEENELQRVVDDYAREGLRPIDISIYFDETAFKLMVLFENSSGRSRITASGFNHVSYQAEFSAMVADGYRPICLSGVADGSHDRYAVIWEKENIPLPSGSYTVTGLQNDSLMGLDLAVKSFMQDRDITAGSLCVAVGDTIVYERGYGWQDYDLERPLRASALFRIASLAKPVTAAAIRKLVAAGAIQLDDYVFDLGQTEPGILSTDGWIVGDERLQNVTIQHLLDHKGGWDRAISGDPIFMRTTIPNALGVDMPASQLAIAEWMVGQPLDFNPGTRYAYSNFGYLLLGLIIEEVVGGDATTWIAQNIFNPIGVTEDDFQLARTLPENRHSREPVYLSPAFGGYNLYHPDRHAAWPDGAWDIEVMEAHGGWITTARAYVTFLQNYWINGEPREGGGRSYTFFGSLDGTRTVARQLPNDISYVAFFNRRSDDASNDHLITSIIEGAISQVSQWPSLDPANVPVELPTLSIDVGFGESQVDLQWSTQEGRVYDLWQSNDLSNWNAVGYPLVGDEAIHAERSVELQEGGSVFFRVSVE